jgi:hypothetical protein
MSLMGGISASKERCDVRGWDSGAEPLRTRMPGRAPLS